MVGLSIIKKQHPHGMVYFIADQPGKENIDPAIPLVGTKSYKTFLSWCAEMDVDVQKIRLFNQSDDPFSGLSGMNLKRAIDLGHIKVIALGKKALNYLIQVDLEEFYALPHPSGLNRALNHRKKLKETLGQCRSYLYRGND